MILYLLSVLSVWCHPILVPSSLLVIILLVCSICAYLCISLTKTFSVLVPKYPFCTLDTLLHCHPSRTETVLKRSCYYKRDSKLPLCFRPASPIPSRKTRPPGRPRFRGTVPPSSPHGPPTPMSCVSTEDKLSGPPLPTWHSSPTSSVQKKFRRGDGGEKKIQSI